MPRFEARLATVMRILTDAGYTAKYVPSTDIEQVDASIELGNGIDVQIDAMSGDAVGVNKPYGTGGSVVGVTWWDVESNDELLPTIKKAIAYEGA